MPDYWINVPIDFGWNIATTSTGPYAVTTTLFIPYDPNNPKPASCSGWEEGSWRKLDELELVLDAIELMVGPDGFGSQSKFESAVVPTTVIRRPTAAITGIYPHALIPGKVVLTDGLFNLTDSEVIYWTVHEFGHRWDWKTGIAGGGLSSGLRKELEDSGFVYIDAQACYSGYGTCETQLRPYLTVYSTNEVLKDKEDWAEVFASFVTGKTSDGETFTHALFPVRFRYIVDQIDAL